MSAVDARALLLFDRYADMDPRTRSDALAALVGEDPDLHRALSALLAADACERPLDRAPVAAVAAMMQARAGTVPDERIGREVGAWRIVGVIGQGGMGTVYRVERADGQYRQTAALKYVRADVSSTQLLDAFRDERNVLASLNHPHVVPLLDGGVDAQGQPWFVMQHVEGEPIDAWCDRNRLSVRDRVALMLQACDAVAYAHARGILHRDIKPSNLLVTADGTIRLLDFGLSSPTSDTRDRKRLAITSGYTAPEVLKGDVPGLAVDVFSLGILLCHLLCGRLPVEPSPARHQPRAPGSLVATMTPAMLAARSTTARALKATLGGGLDSIVLRCVQEDPDARYAGVEQLRADLANWLARRPVSAHGSGIGYRSLCFVRRNAWLSATVAVALVAATALAGTWAWQRIQAEREQVAASHVDRLLESSIGMATLSGMGDIPLTPATMLQRSEDHLRSATLAGEPDVRSRGLSILGRSWAALGDYDRAEALVREARSGASGNPLQAAFDMATLAQIQNLQAQHAAAEASASEGLARLPVGLSNQYQLARVRLMIQLAAAQSGLGRSADAFRTVARAIDAAAKLPKESADPVVAQLLIQRGTWYRWRYRMAESDADLQRAIALTRDRDPVIADDARESLVRTVRASRAVGREQRAMKVARDLLASRRATLGERHPQTGVAWTELAFIRLLDSDRTGAQEAVDQARGILAGTVGESHSAYARMLVAQAFIEIAAGRIDAAIEHVERATAIYRRNNGDTHELTLDARFLLASLSWSRHARSGDDAQRQAAIDLLAATIDDAVAAHGQVSAIHRMAYATLLSGAGRHAQARQEIVRAQSDARAQYGADSQEAMHARLAEASMMIDDGTPDDQVGAALDSLVKDVGTLDTLYARSIAHTAWLERGRWLARAGRIDEARAAYRQAREEAAAASQQGWVDVADIRLRELDTQAAAAD